jgi:signal transduction histidine kinase/DNA-binding response OmpR family regulator
LASYIFLIFLLAGISILSLSEGADRLTSLYFVPIVAASFLTYPHDSFLSAALASTGYALIYTIQPSTTGFNYYAIINFFIVALVASQIALQLDNALRKVQQHAAELDRRVAEQTQHLRETLDRERTEANKLQAILQSMSEGVIVFDQNRKAIVANTNACDILETHEENLLDSDLNHLLSIAATPEDQSLIGLLVGGSGAWTANLRAAWGNKTVAFSLAPVKLPSMNHQGTVVVLRDITQEAQVEQIKSEFMSLVSHELRVPMLAVKGYVDLLATGAAGVLTDTQFDFLEIVKTNSDRLNTMVEGLFELARIETGEIKMHFEAVSLRHIVLDVARTLHPNLESKQLRLDLQIPDSLPEVLADPNRLTQIITSLLSNALKYTFEGKIGVTARIADDHVQVDISDTGIGMTEQDQTKLFTSFFRAPNTRTLKIPGAGLGLTIARSLVEMQGGRIWATSTAGRGSTFSFTIPVFPKPPTPLTPAVSLAEMEQTLARTKVLIVDSELNVGRSLQQQLEPQDYDVLVTTEAAEGMEMAVLEQPHLILLDAMVSGADGFEALQQLKQNPATRAIPVIMTSVLSVRESSLVSGAADFLTRPIDNDQLLSSIKRVLSRAEQVSWSVLVIEDEPEMRRWLSLVLSGQGLTVFEAQDSDQAMTAITEHRPNLILFGLKLTTKDGWTAIRRLRQIPEMVNIPILLLTTSRVDLHYEGKNLLGLGIQQILTKPLSAEVLIRQIRRQLTA